MNNIREEIEAKIKWLERNNHPRALELIEWCKHLLTMLPQEKKEVVKKEVDVEIPETPKKKITFSKKKQFMRLKFKPTDKQAEALQYWEDDTTTEI